MMKTSKKLFEKKIELKDSRINGGLGNSNSPSVTATGTIADPDSCTDVRFDQPRPVGPTIGVDPNLDF